MGFKERVHQIMSHKLWIKDRSYPYNVFRKMIIETLGHSDRRTIAKWLGKKRITWQTKNLNPLYPSTKQKVEEWQEGLLEEFSIVERDFDEEINNYTFKILKDKNSFP